MEGRTPAEVYAYTNKLLSKHGGLIPNNKRQAVTATKRKNYLEKSGLTAILYSAFRC